MVELILAILLAFQPTKHDETEPVDARHDRLAVLAEAIDTAAHGDQTLAAALIVQAHEETHLDAAAASCSCRRFECDPRKSRDGTVTFRAHGYWQMHDAPTWPREWWPSFCETSSIESTTRAARLIARRIDTRKLECSFARLKGLLVPCDAPWAVNRANQARKLAPRLWVRK